MKAMKRFLDLQRGAFKEKLQAKNGWGKNEVMRVFEEANTEAMSKMLEDAANPNSSGLTVELPGGPHGTKTPNSF